MHFYTSSDKLKEKLRRGQRDVDGVVTKVDLREFGALFAVRKEEWLAVGMKSNSDKDSLAHRKTKPLI